MAQFSVEISDSDVLRVINSVASNYGRPDQVDNPDYNPNATIPNPNYDPNLEEGPNNPAVIPDTNQQMLIDNPETKASFANRKVREFLAENVRAYEIRLAKEQAASAVNSTVSITDPQA